MRIGTDLGIDESRVKRLEELREGWMEGTSGMGAVVEGGRCALLLWLLNRCE